MSENIVIAQHRRTKRVAKIRENLQSTDPRRLSVKGVHESSGKVRYDVCLMFKLQTFYVSYQ